MFPNITRENIQDGQQADRNAMIAEANEREAIRADELRGKAILACIATVEKVLRSPKFKDRATCLCVVGQDILVAVHGAQSDVFKDVDNGTCCSGMQKQMSSSPSSGRTGRWQAQSPLDSQST